MKKNLNMKKNKTKHNKQQASLKRIILTFLLYSLIFITIFSFLDYYDFYIINPILLTVLSVILSAISTYIHLKSKKRFRIDDIVGKL